MIMAEAKTNLRLPEELYERIRQLAEQERRSINSQMVVMLEESFAYRMMVAKGYPKKESASGDMS